MNYHYFTIDRHKHQFYHKNCTRFCCKSVKHRLHFSEVECSHEKGGDLRSKYYPTLTAKNP